MLVVVLGREWEGACRAFTRYDCLEDLHILLSVNVLVWCCVDLAATLDTALLRL